MERRKDLVDVNVFRKFEQPGEYVNGFLMGHTIVTDSRGKSYPQYTVFTGEEIVRFNGTVQMEVLRNLPVGTYIDVEFERSENIPSGRVSHFKIKCDPGGLKQMFAAPPAIDEADPFAEDFIPPPAAPHAEAA